MSILYCLSLENGYESIRKTTREKQQKTTTKIHFLFRLNISMEEKKRKEYDTITKWKCLWRRILNLYSCCMDPHRNVSHKKNLVENMFQACNTMTYLFLFLFVFTLFFSTNNAA